VAGTVEGGSVGRGEERRRAGVGGQERDEAAESQSPLSGGPTTAIERAAAEAKE